MRGEGVVENWVKSTQRTLSSDGVVENRSLRAGRLNLNVDFQNKKDRPGVLSLNPCLCVCVFVEEGMLQGQDQISSPSQF